MQLYFYNVLFQKKPNTGEEDILFWKPPWNFYFFYFTPENSRQNKAPPLEIPQSYVRSLESPKARNQDPWKFCISFSWLPLETPLCFYLDPGHTTCYLFDTLGNSKSSPPPPSHTPCFFFWGSPVFHVNIYQLSLKQAKTFSRIF